MHCDDYGGGVGVAQILGERETQQDDFGGLVSNNSSLLVLADGMGGHKAGEQASELVVEEFLHMVDEPNNDLKISRHDLAAALSKANKKIGSRIEQDHSLSGMGTTVIALYKRDLEIQWLSVGDSHLYIYRDKKLTKLNEDHSMRPLLMDLVSEGKLSKGDVESHPLRNRLRSAITGKAVELVDCPEGPLECHKKDILLLCSDGVDVLGQSIIEGIIKKNRKKSSVDISSAIVRAVIDKQHPDQDNTTVATIKFC